MGLSPVTPEVYFYGHMFKTWRKINVYNRTYDLVL